MQMHRSMIKPILCAAMALAFTATAWAALNRVSYISTTGNDTNPCTAKLPCLTIDHALTVTTPGGTIILATAGAYEPATISQAVTIEAVGVDAWISTPAAGNAVTITTTGNVTLNGVNLRGGGFGTDGVMVTQVGVLRLFNLQISNFTSNGVEFDATDGEMNVSNLGADSNGNDGLLVNATGAKAYVDGSGFDVNVNAGAVSELGKLTVFNSSAHFNGTGFAADGGTVTLSNDRAIFNGTGLGVSATGKMRFVNCLVSDSTTAAYNVAAGGLLSGSSPGTTFIVPGQTHTGHLSVANVLE